MISLYSCFHRRGLIWARLSFFPLCFTFLMFHANKKRAFLCATAIKWQRNIQFSAGNSTNLILLSLCSLCVFADVLLVFRHKVLHTQAHLSDLCAESEPICSVCAKRTDSNLLCQVAVNATVCCSSLSPRHTGECMSTVSSVGRHCTDD